MTSGLFFVEHFGGGGTFDDRTLSWTIADLRPGERQTLEVGVQPSTGGVHTLTAELMISDVDDWDSTPGNGEAYEDDQYDACISVPVALACGQYAVLEERQKDVGSTDGTGTMSSWPTPNQTPCTRVPAARTASRSMTPDVARATAGPFSWSGSAVVPTFRCWSRFSRAPSATGITRYS